MKVLIIPDVHGERFWEQATLRPNDYDKIIFLGDYLDSFFIEDDAMIKNLEDIIAFKKENLDKVILLFGNHDLSYYDTSRFGCSGFRKNIKDKLNKIMVDNFDLFQLSYQFDTKVDEKTKRYLFTHAGVNSRWYTKHLDLINSQSGETLSDKLNSLVYSDEGLNAISDVSIHSGGSFWYASPIWMRPEEIKEDSMLYGYTQFVGHTPHKTNKTIKFDNGLQDGSITFLDRNGKKEAFIMDLNNPDGFKLELSCFSRIKLDYPLPSWVIEEVENEVFELVHEGVAKKLEELYKLKKSSEFTIYDESVLLSQNGINNEKAA